MEAIKKILTKIEQPLNFAIQNNFKNLPNIKDLGKSLINLLEFLKRSMPASTRKEDLAKIEELLNVFIDYDGQKLELKKIRIGKAIQLLEQLKATINSNREVDKNNIGMHNRSGKYPI